MKVNELFEIDKQSPEAWLKLQQITGTYTINQDGSVDVHGSIAIKSKIKTFPVKFNEINGDFRCNANQLTSLEGAPREVGGNFYCSNNQLMSLEGAPREVGDNFWCNGNKLTSLEGAPREVAGDFVCHNNQLTSLEGAPREVGGNFWCANNKLTAEDLANLKTKIHGKIRK